MRSLNLAELEAQADEFDRDVLATPGLDCFCSSTNWILPANRALMPHRASWLRRGEAGWVALMRHRRADGVRLLEPLELVWGLACPLATAAPELLAEELAGELERDRDRWEVCALAGLDRSGPLFHSLARRLGRSHRLGLGPSTRRYVADLRGGVDGWLGRRSANVRDTVRKARRRAAALGITVEETSSPPGGGPGRGLAPDAEAELLHARMLAVEARSWKGLEGTGLAAPEMGRFYREMLPLLIRRGLLRLLFARRGDQDVGFIFGAVLAGTYRGLQFSYVEELHPVSLGSLMQYEQIARLAAEGVEAYDMGAEVEYKRRWAEPGLETELLLVMR